MGRAHPEPGAVGGATGRQTEGDLERLLSPDERRRLERVRRVARFLDLRFGLPLVPVRFGMDALLGVIPVVGDSLGLLLAAFIVVEARRLGASPELQGRMLANIGIDWAIGLVPFAGDLLDIAFRANTRNVRLVEAMLEAREREAGRLLHLSPEPA